MSGDLTESLRRAGKILVDILGKLDTIVRPGESCVKVAERLESLIEEQKATWAFPVNICIGNIAAHYTPLPDEQTTIPEDEIIKVDIGVSVDGYIVDKAISLYFGQDDERKALIETANEALDRAIKVVEPGRQISDLTYEVYDYVKSRGFKVISNLHGHMIERWVVHGGKDIPIHPEASIRGCFEEGETYAIEVFVTNGQGYAETLEDVRIYSLPKELAGLERIKLPIHLKAARDIFKWIWRNRKTLPFSVRHLLKVFDRTTVRMGLAVLEHHGLIERYPVLRDPKGSVAQAEDTILVRKDGVDILTRGQIKNNEE